QTVPLPPPTEASPGWEGSAATPSKPTPTAAGGADPLPPLPQPPSPGRGEVRRGPLFWVRRLLPAAGGAAHRHHPPDEDTGPLPAAGARRPGRLRRRLAGP